VTAAETIAVSGGDLRIGSLANMLGTIENFAAGETIVLAGVTADAGTWSGGVLTLTDAGTQAGTLAMAGSYASDGFTVTNAGGTAEVTLACFATGTRIATPDGARAVEDVRVGEDVRLARGGVAEVRWVGRRTVRCDRHPRPSTVWPVRVAAGAFGPGLPARDLWLSPDHAVYVDGVLIPIRCLEDGGGIVQVPRDSITYWHVELARHEVILAEGLPVESFLDTGNRAAFEGGAAALHLHADFSQRLWDAESCAPLTVAGPMLDRARERLRRGSLRRASAC